MIKPKKVQIYFCLFSFFLIMFSVFPNLIYSQDNTKNLKGIFSIGVSYFHPSDFLLLEAYETGKSYYASCKWFPRTSCVGTGISYVHNTRTAKKYSFLGSLTSDEFLIGISYKITEFKKPFSINPFIVFGAGLFYFQETSIPPVFISNLKILLGGYFIEIGIPIKFTNKYGIILQVNNEFVLLPAKDNNFDEDFQIGGISFGLSIAYFL